MRKGLIAASIICLMLCGCGKQSEVDDVFNDTEKAEMSVADNEEKDNEEAAATETAEEAEHKVQFTVANTNNEVEMTADLVIDTRIPENIATKKVKEVVVDEEYLLSLSKSIFDGGKYEILQLKDYTPEECDSLMHEMMDAAEQKAEQYSGLFEPSTYYEYLGSEQATSGDKNQENEEYSENKAILSSSLKVEDAGEDCVCYQERAFIKGDIDGEPYIMEYAKQDYDPNNEMYCDNEDIRIYPMNGRQLCMGISKDEADGYEDNKVSYSDAVSIAEKYIQQLGLNEYSLVKTYEFLNDSSVTGVKGTDGKLTSGESLPNIAVTNEKSGYRFFFTPVIDSMNVSFCAGYERTTAEYDEEGVAKKAWNQPVVQVDVDATGLRGVCINRIYEMEDNMNPDSQIISFEKANEIAKQMYSESYNEQYEVGDIRLEYIVIQYDDQTVMAPAWVYYRLDESGASGLEFAVNALDGSIVHFSYNQAKGIQWIR